MPYAKLMAAALSPYMTRSKEFELDNSSPHIAHSSASVARPTIKASQYETNSDSAVLWVTKGCEELCQEIGAPPK